MDTQEWPSYVRLSRQSSPQCVRAHARLLVPLVLLTLAIAGPGCTIVVRVPKSVGSAQAAQSSALTPELTNLPAVNPPPTETATAAPTPTPAEATPTRVPKATATPTLAPTPTPTNTATPTPAPLSYVVQPGDSVYKIAARYGISPHILADYNRLANPSYLQVGQVLLIPQGGPQPVNAPDGDLPATAPPPSQDVPDGAPPEATARPSPEQH